MSYRDIFDKRGHLYNEAHTISPQARDAEANALIKWLQPKPGETIVVTSAGGGYDSCRIAEHLLPDSANIICVEPSERFSAMIPEMFQVFNVPLDKIPLPNECADAVVNLAAMHHCENRDVVFDEWSRILKPGGRLVIADVEAGSGNGDFLNTIVDAFTPGGHQGIFLIPEQLKKTFINRGYSKVEEALESYKWLFKSTDEMVRFSRSLFGMTNATYEQIQSGIEQYLSVAKHNALLSVSLQWSLRFFKAYK